MKSMLMAIMAVTVAVTFSAPAFAGEEKEKKDEKKGGHVLVYGEEKSEKKDEKKGACDLTVAGLLPCLLVDPSQAPMLPCNHVHSTRIGEV